MYDTVVDGNDDTLWSGKAPKLSQRRTDKERSKTSSCGKVSKIDMIWKIEGTAALLPTGDDPAKLKHRGTACVNPRAFLLKATCEAGEH